MENHKKTPVRVRFRVTAKKRGCDGGASCSGKRGRQRDCVNSVRKLQRREIGALPRMARGAASDAAEKFRNIQLQVRIGLPRIPLLSSIYKVFDLKNYNFLYAISDKNVQEIKISQQITATFSIKQVRDSELTEVSRTEFMTPSAFIFLYENHLFLTFRNRTVAVWNFRGELVTSFEDHLLWHPDCNTNNIYITSDQDLIISYCKAEEGCGDEGEVSAVGSINMSNILTGKCIAKISASDPALQISPRQRCVTGRSSIRSTVREALEDVTALFYDEERNEIYTGNKQGLIHVWSS
ncbi:hypothetical protein GW17_00026519 [Ensete ventricosum]|uniref:Uncharacterized protein n=1 Tax=Ensete ventricosum TaxID=4639 RepID=A0A427AFA7_ENSVE|nr:hypothetical protein B296_00031830 [Ensete ventricosum]RWW09964.1 hypothetical protein GW17_00026519 [Ensete ventricosum]